MCVLTRASETTPSGKRHKLFILFWMLRRGEKRRRVGRAGERRIFGPRERSRVSVNRCRARGGGFEDKLFPPFATKLWGNWGAICFAGPLMFSILLLESFIVWLLSWERRFHLCLLKGFSSFSRNSYLRLTSRPAVRPRKS